MTATQTPIRVGDIVALDYGKGSVGRVRMSDKVNRVARVYWGVAETWRHGGREIVTDHSWDDLVTQENIPVQTVDDGVASN